MDVGDLRALRGLDPKGGDFSRRARGLPQVQRLLETAEAQRLCRRFPRPQVVEAVRASLRDARAGMAATGADPPDAGRLMADAARRLEADARSGLRRVLNATGVVLHTNLGRAPLPRAAAEAMAQAAQGYCSLEFELDTGRRGGRGAAVEDLARRILGCEAALAVNNAAGAVLLALSGLAAGGEVVVSRGELVEIGGGFRIPEVIAQGGARLVEVGTTNKTRLADYLGAIGPETRVLLKVHQSNYRVVGFTAAAGLEELAEAARRQGLVLMYDLGSGALADLPFFEGSGEPGPRDALAAGADLVAFSGDKLMGGPQAGILAGRSEIVARLKRHPLFRALRPDKVTLAGLEATLRLYLDPQQAVREIPTLRMLSQTAAAVRARAERLQAALEPGLDVELVASRAEVGGGSVPGQSLASWALAIAPADGDLAGLSARLRGGDPAVAGRVNGGRLLLDLFTIADAEVGELAAAVNAALRA